MRKYKYERIHLQFDGVTVEECPKSCTADDTFYGLYVEKSGEPGVWEVVADFYKEEIIGRIVDYLNGKRY